MPPVESDLLARIQRLEDIKEIEGLIYRYAWHVPRGEGKELGELFAEDGVLNASARFQGRTRIAEYISSLPANLTIPVVSNILVELDGDNARATCKMTSLWVGDGPALVGWYEDEFRRVAGRWLFSHRRWRSHDRPAAGSKVPPASAQKD